MVSRLDAVISLRPKGNWALHPDGSVECYDPDVTPPTAAEIDAEVARLQTIEPLKAEIEQAKKYLAESDWVVVKITELNLNGLDVSNQYLDILSHRKLMREVINAKETEIANV